YFLSFQFVFFIVEFFLSNNIRDLDNDKISGRKTIAILLGHRGAVIFLASLFAAAYITTLILIIIGTLPLWSLITFISIGVAIKVINGFIGKTSPLEMMPAMIATGKTNTIYGFLLGISLLISIFV